MIATALIRAVPITSKRQQQVKHLVFWHIEAIGLALKLNPHQAVVTTTGGD